MIDQVKNLGLILSFFALVWSTGTAGESLRLARSQIDTLETRLAYEGDAGIALVTGVPPADERGHERVQVMIELANAATQSVRNAARSGAVSSVTASLLFLLFSALQLLQRRSHWGVRVATGCLVVLWLARVAGGLGEPRY